MTIINDYLELTEKYKKEYGEKTLLLMQVGSFFEAYGLRDKENKIYGSNISDFADINDMTISKKNICVGKDHVVMAGFGLPQLEKYVKKLQESGYTIPVYTQDTPTKNTTRSLHTIYSPGTYFSNDTKELSNNTVCIWIHHFKCSLYKTEQITVGISNIDIYTGKTSVFEFTNEFLHNPATYDELERYISIYHPNECVIVSNLDTTIINDIINYTSITSQKIHIINITEDLSTDMVKSAKNAEKQIYQQEVIKNFYPDKNDEVILNNLQNYCIAIQSFIYLLDFTYRHNPNLINNISEPIFENYTSRLILANHSLKQLNVIPDNRYSGKHSCVSNLLNNCITPMGKRNFLYNLLNPTTDKDTLSESYDITEHLLKKDSWNYYRTNMEEIRDIEKLRRKLCMKKISPKDFTQLYDNINKIISLYKTSLKDKKLNKYLQKQITDINQLPELCDNIIYFINENLDIDKSRFIDDVSQEKLGNNSIDNIFYIKKNLDRKIDNCYKKSLECVQEYECIRKYLSDLIVKYEKSTKTTEFVKINETAKMDSTLQTTKRRATFLKKAIDIEVENTESGLVSLKFISKFSNEEEIYMFDLKNLEYNSSSGSQTNIIITSPEIRKIASLINTSKSDLISELEIYYNQFVDKFIIYNLDNIINYIINLDILQCKCYIAKEFNYCKPNIKENNKSFIEFTGIRHCLIEHLNIREIYVTNDLKLGHSSLNTLDNSETNGILLYGTNAVGKTSFIKAIGISLIMAQAGLYVPATSFTFSPYTTIFTRILGNDNIFKGLSTFAVEMTELRTILELADKNSMILGDELCSGTESDSALSIFVSGLEILHKRECTFLFATHFHEIVKYDEIIALTKMEMYHMSVVFDKVNNKLIYDRKLKKGPGESMYGLEVCKSLNLSNDFLNRAHDIRVKYNKIYKNVLSQDTSKYNSKKIREKCEFCKINNGTEIHHLEYQKNADNNNFIETNNTTFHKNHVANLINICEECHQKIHKKNDKLSIKKTSLGYELSIE